MVNPPYLIYETANAHGGSYEHLEATISACAALSYPRRGIKFHPIAANALATKDFPYFDVYEELEIAKNKWASLIKSASRSIGDVWIEMADVACANTFVDNFDLVVGVKFQASMVDNAETISVLQDCDLSAKTAIVNISGYELGAIQERVSVIVELGFSEVVLQVGFQDYPTRSVDLAMNKISILRSAFPHLRVSFADHIDAASPYAKQAPLVAFALGCDIIEKHVCLNRGEAKYDHYSSLEPGEMAELQDGLLSVSSSFSDRFIPTREKSYLVKSLVKPLLATEHAPGRLIAKTDLRFRRSAHDGLSYTDLAERQRQRFVPASTIGAGQTVSEHQLRKATVGTIVAARLKSSRLPKKAVLPVAGRPLVEWCLTTCKLNAEVDHVILASSTHPQDTELAEYDLQGTVPFRRGDPDDVIVRYLEVAEEFGIDVIVRVTGDNPIISPEVTQILVNEHFARGADYTAARRETVGATPQIISTWALRRVVDLLGAAPYSEYMNQYFENNPDIFKVERIDIPDEYVRDYRLTVDYAEDLQMFEALFGELIRRNMVPSLKNAITVLDERPDIAAINAGIKPAYHTQKDLIDKLKKETRIPPERR